MLAALLISRRISTVPDAFGFSRRRRFRKEWKPRAGHAMHDTVVLRAIGDRCRLRVYYFSDDFKHFFYQIVLAVRCLWYCGIFIYDPRTRAGRFVLEMVLAMGYTSCSNIAQMICDGLLYIFEEDMDAAELRQRDCGSDLARILAERHRRHGPRHGRGYTTRGYTDDILLVLLGVARLVRAAVVWRTLLRTARILGAEGHKRQAGTWVLFLGITLLATALLAALPEAKAFRALTEMQRMLDGVLSKDDTGRLLGLLVHLHFLRARGKASTAGMWRCLRHTRSDPVTLDGDERALVEAYYATVKRCRAAPMDVVMRRVHRARDPPATALVSENQSDAFRELPAAGAGGYSAAVLWRADTSAFAAAPISGHELLALWLHLVVMQAEHAVADRVNHFVDNMNAFLAVTRE